MLPNLHLPKYSFFSFAFALLVFAGSVSAQSKLNFKVGVGSVFMGHVAGELEFKPWNQTTICLKAGLINPNWENGRKPGDGYFLKAGPKFYLNEEKAPEMNGIWLKPELMFGHFRDWETNVRGNFGNRWVNSFGLFANAGYHLSLGARVFLEGSIALGLVQQYEKTIMYNDQPPFEAFESSYDRVFANEQTFYENSQVSILGPFSASGSLMLGIKL